MREGGGGHAQIDVTLKNGTEKAITAWRSTVTATFSDGSTNASEVIVDFVTDLLSPNQDSTFRPGTSRTFQQSAPLGLQGQSPVSVVANLSMVAFSDRTAIGDIVQINRLASSRGSMARVIDQQTQVIQKALDGPSPASTLRALVTDRKNRFTNGPMPERILALLDSGALPDGAAVKAILNSQRMYQALLVAQSYLSGPVNEIK